MDSFKEIMKKRLTAFTELGNCISGYEEEVSYKNLMKELSASGYSYSVRKSSKNKSSDNYVFSYNAGKKEKSPSINLGYPFQSMETSLLECSLGPHYYKREKETDESDLPSCKKKRFHNNETKKMGWPAWMSLKRVKVFTEYVAKDKSWRSRMWWFGGGIFMKDLAGFEHETLMLVGVYTLAVSGIILLLGGTVGRWIDRTPRFKAVVIMLVIQNSLVVLCALTVITMFIQWEFVTKVWGGILLRILQGFVILTASVAQLASCGTQIIVQKDWIVVLCAGNLDHLAKCNSILRTIDLTSQVLAPFAVGLVRDHLSKMYSAVLIGCWNIFSLFAEYYIYRLIYIENEALKTKPRSHEEWCAAKNAVHEICPEIHGVQREGVNFFYKACYRDWRVYFTHPIRFAGLALSCLYLTVLGFDAVTTAYGDTQMQISFIATAQALSAVVGVIGSISFTLLRKCLYHRTIGILGLSLQISALMSCVVSVWLPGSPFNVRALHPDYKPNTKVSGEVLNPEDTRAIAQNTSSIYILCAGIIASRYGLWLVDISITQIMQETIEEEKRGMINGIQDALNMGMDMIKSGLVIAFPFPEQFGLLIFLSFLSICFGFGSYCVFYREIGRYKPPTPPQRRNQEMKLPEAEPSMTESNEAEPSMTQSNEAEPSMTQSNLQNSEQAVETYAVDITEQDSEHAHTDKTF